MKLGARSRLGMIIMGATLLVPLYPALHPSSRASGNEAPGRVAAVDPGTLRPSPRALAAEPPRRRDGLEVPSVPDPVPAPVHAGAQPSLAIPSPGAVPDAGAPGWAEDPGSQEDPGAASLEEADPAGSAPPAGALAMLPDPPPALDPKSDSTPASPLADSTPPSPDPSSALDSPPLTGSASEEAVPPPPMDPFSSEQAAPPPPMDPFSSSSTLSDPSMTPPAPPFPFETPGTLDPAMGDVPVAPLDGPLQPFFPEEISPSTEPPVTPVTPTFPAVPALVAPATVEPGVFEGRLEGGEPAPSTPEDWILSAAADAAMLLDSSADRARVYARRSGELEVLHRATGLVAHVTVAARPPIPDAGQDRQVVLGSEGVTFLLDGSGSYDPEGAVLAARWELIDGPGAVLSPVDSLVTDVTVTQPGNYSFLLSVTNVAGSRSDAVLVRVVEPSAEISPPADSIGTSAGTLRVEAGFDLLLSHPETMVHPLRIAGSAGVQEATLTWIQVGGPAAPAAAAMEGLLESWPAEPGTYLYRLVGYRLDPAELDTDDLMVTVLPAGASPSRVEVELFEEPGGSVRLDARSSVPPTGGEGLAPRYTFRCEDPGILLEEVEPGIVRLPALAAGCPRPGIEVRVQWGAYMDRREVRAVVPD